MALKLKGSTSGFVGLDAPAVAGNNTLILPENSGSAGQILANDITAGVTTFTSVTVNRNGDLTVPGTISIGGTLTYEDVTSIDSVGIVTARSGVRVNGGGLTIIGDTTGLKASGISTFGGTVSIADSIVHTGDTNTAIRFPEADHISMETGGSERLRIKGNGNIGLGTDDPNNKLHVYGGQIKAQSSKDDTNTYVDLLRAQSGSTGLALFAVRAANAADDNSNWDIKTNASEDLSFTIGAGSEKARITSSGYVGIGTDMSSSGTRMLHIFKGSCGSQNTRNGELVIESNNAASVQLLSPSTTSPGILFGDESAGSVGKIEYNHSTNQLSFSTNGSANKRLRITSGGDLIHTSTEKTLSLVETQNIANKGTKIAFFGADRYDTDEEFAAIKGLLTSNSGGSGNKQNGGLQFIIGSASHTHAMTQAGNVGFGTGIPARRFHAKGSDNVIGKFQNDQSLCLIEFQDTDTTSGNRPSIGSDGNNAIVFAGGSERARIDSSGRLLVGTDTAMTTGLNDHRDTIQGVDTAGAQLLLGRNDTSAVATNRLGEIAALGNDANGTYQVGASIRFEADANHGNDDKPTAIVFKTCSDGSATNTERMRLASNGSLINSTQSAKIAWGTITGVLYSGFSRYDGAAQDVGISHYATTNAGTSFVEHFRMEHNGTLKGTDTSIGSLSDIRLKKDVADYSYDISKFKQFKPKSFNWINPEVHGDRYNVKGFIAQDIETVDGDWVEDSWIKESDPDFSLISDTTTKNGAGETVGISKISKFGYKDAMYISVIQQLIGRIETLEAKVAALEG